MVNFKKGDRVIVSGKYDFYSNGLGVIEDVGGPNLHGVRLDNGRYVAADVANIFFITTPPKKIQQDGYEYELVGPVKPDWLVDGDWVVDKETGRKYRVSCDNEVYTFNNGTREVIIDFISLPTRFRPHTASDWKWGDWALYAGRKVFVMTSTNNHGCVAVSYPDIYPLGANEANRNFLLVKHDELTPIF